MTDTAINADELRTQLAAELGLASMAPDKQEEALEMALGSLFKVIYTESMAKIGEQGMNEYEALMEKSPTEEEVAQFFRTRIPDYDAFVAGIVLEFKQAVALK